MKQIRGCSFGFIIMLLTLAAAAQNSRIGAFSYGSGGGIDIKPKVDVKQEPEFIKVADKIYRADQCESVEGEISYKTGEILILETNRRGGNSRMITTAIKNFRSSAASGQRIRANAVRIGDYTWNEMPLEYYDCGIIPSKTELIAYLSEQSKQESDRLAILRAAQEKANAEAKAKVAAQKQAAAARALKVNQDAAAKGDMFGLLRMGERYRDGDGVEKDLSKAREYLQKAADAGSPTAKEELANLKQ